jgi:hypothetical protein
MRRTAILTLALLSILVAAPWSESQNRRSFVGRKLPPQGWVDTEGHRILPKDYEGSVLVVYGGIPW